MILKSKPEKLRYDKVGQKFSWKCNFFKICFYRQNRKNYMFVEIFFSLAEVNTHMFIAKQIYLKTWNPAVEGKNMYQNMLISDVESIFKKNWKKSRNSHSELRLNQLPQSRLFKRYRWVFSSKYIYHWFKLALKKTSIWPCKRFLYNRKVNISVFTASLNYLITMKTILFCSSPSQANNQFFKQNITK